MSERNGLAAVVPSLLGYNLTIKRHFERMSIYARFSPYTQARGIFAGVSVLTKISSPSFYKYGGVNF